MFAQPWARCLAGQVSHSDHPSRHIIIILFSLSFTAEAVPWLPWGGAAWRGAVLCCQAFPPPETQQPAQPGSAPPRGLGGLSSHCCLQAAGQRHTQSLVASGGPWGQDRAQRRPGSRHAVRRGCWLQGAGLGPYPAPPGPGESREACVEVEAGRGRGQGSSERLARKKSSPCGPTGQAGLELSLIHI